ncbi:MAG: ABC transporter substrate-binding protein [Stackebrandtia sp.]
MTTLLGGVVGSAIAEATGYCDSDLGIQRMADDECVGASDGSFVFDDAYREVMSAIAEQNREVDRTRETLPERGYATIAVWIPHPTDADAPNDTTELLHQLEGAYLAQRKANEQPDPPIRLLVANGGTGNRHWASTCTDLKQRKDSDNLVAVTGMGSSYRSTKKAIACLDEAEVPTIGSVLTADGMVDDYPYAYRVAPSNSSEGAALTAYLKADPEAEYGMKVSSLDTNDTYSATLSAAFTDFDSDGGRLENNQSFDPTKPGLKAQFTDIAANVCYFRPDVLLYAGRGRDHLESFIEALGSSNCVSDGYRPRVVTGDDASLMSPKDSTKTLLRNEIVTMDYVSLAHPGQWKIDSPVSGLHSGLMSTFVDRYERTFTGPAAAGLDDGHAIMAFDAVEVPITVLTDRGRKPSAAAVASGLQQLRDCSAVTGLSGLIEFNQDGNVDNKAVAILRAGADERNSVQAVSWPRGKATKPADSC